MTFNAVWVLALPPSTNLFIFPLNYAILRSKGVRVTVFVIARRLVCELL